MEHLARLYAQHKDWPGLKQWVFVEAADAIYADSNPHMTTAAGLSVDGTTEFLQELQKTDDRVRYIPFGFTSHSNPAQGKCAARTSYLAAADKVKPQFIVVLDADEYYCKQTQRQLMTAMATAESKWKGFCFKHRHPWHPPSISHLPLFSHEVVGGFWDIPLCRGWRWQIGLRYRANHNTPETSGGLLLDEQLLRLYGQKGCPECIHMAFTSAVHCRRAKHQYYVARGEGRTDHRQWYVDSRAAYETWRPGATLPNNARVIKYNGPIPECFATEIANDPEDD